jgi:predicted Ser/Thr protein kinase
MPALDSLPAKIGPYRLHEKIGEGGMGVVYLASDLENRPVAVKVLGPAVAGDPNARRRLAREVETMRLVRSRNVAEIVDADVNGPAPYIVTRYVNGRTLDAAVRDDGPLYGPALDRLAIGLANAIAAIHAAGVVHRDLKPGNVLLDGDEPVVIDFGIAHIPDATRLTQTGMVMGTPGYLAPEVIEGQPSSGASDVHSWGATVAFAATGRQPYGVGTYQTIFFRVLHGKADLTGVPARWLPSVVAALDVNPARRPPVWQLAAGPTASMPFQQPLQAQQAQPARAAVAYQYRGPAEMAADVADLLPPVDYSRPRSLIAAAPVGLAAAQAVPAGPVAPAAAAVPDDLPDVGFGLVSLGMGVGVVALALLLPVAGTAIALALITLLRAADRAQSSLAERRSLRGARPSDIVIVIVSAPWTVVRATLVTLLLAPVTLLVAGAAAGAAVAFGRAQTLPAAGSWAAGAAVAWYCVGPGSRGPRRQLRRMTGSVIKTRVAMLAALISTWSLGAAAVSAMLSQPPLIWPATTWVIPHLWPSLGLQSLGRTLHTVQGWLLRHSMGMLHLP